MCQPHPSVQRLYRDVRHRDRSVRPLYRLRAAIDVLHRLRCNFGRVHLANVRHPRRSHGSREAEQRVRPRTAVRGRRMPYRAAINGLDFRLDWFL